MLASSKRLFQTFTLPDSVLHLITNFARLILVKPDHTGKSPFRQSIIQIIFLAEEYLKIFSQQYCHKFRFEMSNILNILTSTTSVARTFSTNCYSPFKERYLCYFSSSDAHWQTLYRFCSSSQSPVFALKRFIDQSKVTCFRETRKINNNNNVSNGPFQLLYHSYPIFFEWNKLIKKKKLHFWGTRVHVYTLVTKNFPPTFNFRGSQWAGQCNFGREISC